MPPYEELPLRDALSAAPEVMASMPEESRREVARRLEEARGAEGDEPALITADEEESGVAALVRGGDAAREAGGKDALVLGAIEPSPEGLALAPMDADLPEGPLVLPLLEGRPSTMTANLEEAALRGRAGAILHDLARRADAQELVRTTGLPVGVVAMDHTLYVNASWLVAMSALEPAGAFQGAPMQGGMFAPPRKPQSVGHNPYNLPESLAECASEVRGVCTCATASQCDHEPTDKTFADGQAECTWVNSAEVNAEALCVLALMSIDGVRECVQKGGAECAQLPVTTREQALLFVADAGCMSVLDACLAFGEPRIPGGSDSSGGSCDSCDNDGCDGCDGDGCNDDCSGCNDNCSKCNDNCADCNDNCADCNQNSSDCKNGTPGCRSCSVRAADRGGAPAGEPPAGTLVMLAAPALFILRRARRRP